LIFGTEALIASVPFVCLFEVAFVPIEFKLKKIFFASFLGNSGQGLG
jgi:hypothetical protein